MRKRLVITIGTIIMAVIGALLFVNLFGTLNFNFEALELQLSIGVFKEGITQLEIPPLGLIRAHTHDSPVKIIIRLENIDLDLIRQFLEDSPNQQQIIDRAEQHAKLVIKQIVTKILFLGAVGASFGVFLIHRYKPAVILKGALIGILIIALLLSFTYNTYEVNEFLNPEYEGVLKFAPWMIGLAEEALGKINLLNEQINLISENLFQVFKRIEDLKPLGEAPGDIKVLHVSDLHNNPAGLSLIQRVSALFDVDFIIDTGDISDFGSPLEALLLRRLEALTIPYLFIPGNHDSPNIIKEMQNIKNVEVVNGHFVIKGIIIEGLPDPASNTMDFEPFDIYEMDYFEGINSRLDRLERNPDIIALHNYRIGRELAGRGSVIMFGHSHQYGIEEKDGSVLINSGTSGASGIRGLKANYPYTVVLLHFRQQEGEFKLVAADTIKVLNLDTGFTLERKIFNNKPTAN